MYRRLIFAATLLACAASTPAQRTALRADETVYQLRSPQEAGLARKHGRAQNVGTTHGDMVRPELSDDVVAVPASIPSTVRPDTLIAQIGVLPKTAAPDIVGAFRFICTPGQVSYDDPIVYPGQPGKSHLHQWFGNTGGDAHSTYASLRTSGKSTCVNILNRSAYWMPAMLDGRGNVVRPDYVSIYYKRRPQTDPWCAVQGKACVDLPRGLRFVFGYDMQFGTRQEPHGYFNCDGPTAKPGHYPTITEAAKNCPAGNRLGAVISAPDCWDGKRLDSRNHREHVGYGGYGDGTGRYICPASHPYIIPSFTMGAWYTVDEQRADSWYLSSDEMPGMERMPAGTTFHADWFGAWDDDVMATWTKNCINGLKSCNSGDLGDGRQLKETTPLVWKTPNRLVPVPARPGGTTS